MVREFRNHLCGGLFSTSVGGLFVKILESLRGDFPSSASSWDFGAAHPGLLVEFGAWGLPGGNAKRVTVSQNLFAGISAVDGTENAPLLCQSFLQLFHCFSQLLPPSR
jgi:hypothetical protein